MLEIASNKSCCRLYCSSKSSFSNCSYDISKSDTIPTNVMMNNESFIEHEATVSKINEEQLFYLMSRGIKEKDAVQMIIMGFIEPFSKELPMEYAVELNQLIKMDMNGSVG